MGCGHPLPQSEYKHNRFIILYENRLPSGNTFTHNSLMHLMHPGFSCRISFSKHIRSQHSEHLGALCSTSKSMVYHVKKVCLTLNITPRFRRFPKDIIVPSKLQHGGSPPMLENCSGLCAAQPGIHWDAFPSLFDAGDLTPRDIARRTPAVTYAAQDAKTAPGRWAIDSRSI